MNRSLLVRGLVATSLCLLLAGELAHPAQAQVPLVNVGLGVFRVLNAINRRNRVYQAARDTGRDFSAYYASLQSTAREQLGSGELRSLRQGEGGLQAVRVGAYLRLTEALQAEQTAVTRAIDAETNQARREFNRTLVRQLQEVVVQLPGAQQIIGQVRTLISNMRSTLLALQTAAASNQPLEVLSQRLAEQVSSSAAVQQAVRNLGSMVGPDMDRSLGGALTRVNQALGQVSQEAGNAVTVLDGVDAQVAALDLSQAHPAQREVALGPVPIRLTERATAAVDVASQALAFLSLGQSPGGTTQEQLYSQIRQDMLNERNQALLEAALHVSQVDCLGVGRGEYETAAAMLGQTPQTAADPLNARYMVCRDRTTWHPVRAWLVRVQLPTQTTGGPTATPTEQVRGEIPVGTYRGTTTVPDDYEYTPIENRIWISIAQDGTASGELYVLMDGTFEHVPGCPSYGRLEIRAPIEGRLTSAAGEVQLAWHQDGSSTPQASGSCPIPDRSASADSYDWSLTAQITTADDALHGEVWSGDMSILLFSFDAVRE